MNKKFIFGILLILVVLQLSATAFAQVENTKTSQFGDLINYYTTKGYKIFTQDDDLRYALQFISTTSRGAILVKNSSTNQLYELRESGSSNAPNVTFSEFEVYNITHANPGTNTILGNLLDCREWSLESDYAVVLSNTSISQNPDTSTAIPAIKLDSILSTCQKIATFGSDDFIIESEIASYNKQVVDAVAKKQNSLPALTIKINNKTSIDNQQTFQLDKKESITFRAENVLFSGEIVDPSTGQKTTAYRMLYIVSPSFSTNGITTYFGASGSLQSKANTVTSPIDLTNDVAVGITNENKTTGNGYATCVQTNTPGYYNCDITIEKINGTKIADLAGDTSLKYYYDTDGDNKISSSEAHTITIRFPGNTCPAPVAPTTDGSIPVTAANTPTVCATDFICKTAAECQAKLGKAFFKQLFVK